MNRSFLMRISLGIGGCRMIELNNINNHVSARVNISNTEVDYNNIRELLAA